MRVRVVSSVIGAVLVLAGVAVTYWPASLVLAGCGLLGLGLLTHAPDADR